MKKTYYPQTTSEINMAEMELEILKYWEKDQTFIKSIRGEKDFVFYDGPPFANGLPHYGHLLTGYIKDIYARYRTMLGEKVERKFGWDCHGLPAEMSAEKSLGISGRAAIEEFGIDKFNDQCRTSVMKFSQDWQEYITRQARWVDFENSYKTMDKSFMESVLWAFKELYKKGLIYESSKVLPYSWSCETPVSNFETKLDNSYRKKTSKAATIALKLTTIPPILANTAKSCRILIWTTTPWTLPSNLATAVGEGIKYIARINGNGEATIAAQNYFDKSKLFEDTEQSLEISYKDLVGMSYESLFPYFANRENCFKVLHADFVTADDGTGIVHMAPGFGEDDFNLCAKHDIKLVCPVDNAGKFTNEIKMFSGMQVFDANNEVIKYLKIQGNWVETEQYIHNYPHCWRTDTPLIYKAVSSWYLAVETFRDRMCELSQQINWVPAHIKDRQFAKWLADARDWSISRNRFWGTPIPIWKSNDPNYPRVDVYGSIAELERDFNTEVTDLHRPFIDNLTRKNPDDPTGKSTMCRVPEVLDCWFESGSMPYGQPHYPFENKEWFEKNFPADFITEYTAQTRGWFYTMLVLSTALFDTPPFKNCVCHGVVLDVKGQKLSKRLNNYSSPLEIFNKYGSDSLRFLMASSSVCHGGNLLLDKEGKMIKDVIRLIIKPIWNAYHFFCMYANADGIKALLEINKEAATNLDVYILNKCFQMIERVKHGMDKYTSVKSCQSIIEFFDILNNWYIRRNRDRFWRKECDANKIAAYNTLYIVLHKVARCVAPLLPVTMELIWLGIGGNQSVHLQPFPEVEPYNNDLIKKMDLTRAICSAGLSIRNKHNIRIRQSLSEAVIYSHGIDLQQIEDYFGIIKEELNIRSLSVSSNIDKVAKFVIKPHFQKLAERLPKSMQDIVKNIKSNNFVEQPDGTLLINNRIQILESEYEKTLETNNTSTEVVPGYNMVIYLDEHVSEELLIEGKMRDLVRHIQQVRKSMDLNISEHICVSIKTDDLVILEALKTYRQYIQEQTLSSSIKLVDKLAGEKHTVNNSLCLSIVTE